MRIITHDDGRCLTLRLMGELDHAAAQTVMPGIEDAVEEYLPRRCVLDLTGVSFMDSSGIAVILKTDRLLRQTGGALVLCGVPRQVRRVLDVAGLTNIVKYGYGYCGYWAIVFIIVPLLTVGYKKNRDYLKGRREADEEPVSTPKVTA